MNTHIVAMPKEETLDYSEFASLYAAIKAYSNSKVYRLNDDLPNFNNEKVVLIGHGKNGELNGKKVSDLPEEFINKLKTSNEIEVLACHLGESIDGRDSFAKQLAIKTDVLTKGYEGEIRKTENGDVLKNLLKTDDFTNLGAFANKAQFTSEAKKDSFKDQLSNKDSMGKIIGEISEITTKMRELHPFKFIITNEGN